MNKGNKYRKIFLLISVIGFFNISDKEAAIVSPSTPIQEGINTAKNGLITWFDDSIPAQGWSYSYGGSTKLEIIGADEKARGKIIKASFDDRAYSGVTIARGISYDLTSLRNTGALRFRVKGGQGGERFYIGILDDESDKKDKKIQAKLYSEDFFNVSKEWQQVEIRLSEFPQIGEWWDNKKNAAGVDDIDWSKILEIRFSTDKEANTMQCTADHLAAIFIDGIEITGSSAAPIKPRIDRWWKRKEPVTPVTSFLGQSGNAFFTWFAKGLPEIGSVYLYGGMTDFRKIAVSPSDSMNVFATYLDNREYSGVTIYRGNIGAIEVKPYRAKGGLEFWVKGGKGGEIFYIGLLDDESDGINRKVQTKCDISKYTTITTKWQMVKIPFNDFAGQGLWWDPDTRREIYGIVDWSKISELRFSCEKYENRERCQAGEPVRLYFSNIRFVQSLDNYFDKRQYWAAFHSDAEDLIIDDFENSQKNMVWKTSCDSESTIQDSFIASNDPSIGSVCMKINYNLHVYGSVTFDFERDASSAQVRDWSRHSAIALSVFTDEQPQPVQLVIIDEGHEAWSAVFHVEKGWNNVSLPFLRFERYRWWQPENARANGKLDLKRMMAYEFHPTQTFKQQSFIIDTVRLTNIALSVKEKPVNSIRLNQVWYYPASLKRCIVADSGATSFALFDAQKTLVKTGMLSSGKRYDASSEWIKTGDFTEVDKPGTYKMVIQESGDSQTIHIGQEPCAAVFNASIKAFYYQRASMDITSDFAGQWGRKGGHLDTNCIFHPSTGKSGTLRSPGGWYDAGDYGKYVVNAGITVGTLLALHELFPSLAGDGSLHLPESGNGKNDLLDEVKYELDWLATMQDNDGGVYFKIGALEWDGFVLPAESKQPRYVIGKSTASTLNFAAIMAQAARVYREYDKGYARNCQKRAESAWQWAHEHPKITEPEETGGTGAYGDNTFNDEFFWAACELFISTGKSCYKKYVVDALPINPPNAAAEWNMVKNLGYYSLCICKNKLPGSSKQSFREEIISLGDRLVSGIDSIPYRIPIQDFRWGSNAAILNHAIILCYAHRFSKGSKYLDGIIETIDYIFGKNATGYSFVTGFGALSPLHPHHRIMGSDANDLPIPGFLVGGPNSNRDDELREGVVYPFKEPAKSYVDNVDAYAVNEVCINWNAALAFVLGYLTAYWSNK